MKEHDLFGTKLKVHYLRKCQDEMEYIIQSCDVF